MPRGHFPTGKNADPKFRSERARIAARAGASLDTAVRRVVDRAPELTPEQRDRIAVALRSAGPVGGRTE